MRVFPRSRARWHQSGRKAYRECFFLADCHAGVSEHESEPPSGASAKELALGLNSVPERGECSDKLRVDDNAAGYINGK